MLNHHTLPELHRVFRWSGAGGGLGVGVALWLANKGETIDSADLISCIAAGSLLLMILSSAYITWRKTA